MTAKLSKLFHERLGEQIADELVAWFNAVDSTYRSDLRETNELNFARFDAKLEQRFAQQGAWIDGRFAVAEVKGEQRFADADVKVQRRFSELESRLVTLMFTFWVGTVATLSAIMFALLRAHN